MREQGSKLQSYRNTKNEVPNTVAMEIYDKFLTRTLTKSTISFVQCDQKNRSQILKLHIKINLTQNNTISKVLHKSIQFQTPDFILPGHPYLEAAESFYSPLLPIIDRLRQSKDVSCWFVSAAAGNGTNHPEPQIFQRGLRRQKNTIPSCNRKSFGGSTIKILAWEISEISSSNEPMSPGNFEKILASIVLFWVLLSNYLAMRVFLFSSNSTKSVS